MSRSPRAEKMFWDAFERLKKNEPQRLPKGTFPHQANVAREAGVSPSALRKKRFPVLVAAIQQWSAEHGEQAASKPRVSAIEGRQKARSLREQIATLAAQRDTAVSLLTSADARILELTMECERLRAVENSSSVVSINAYRQERKE